MSFVFLVWRPRLWRAFQIGSQKKSSDVHDGQRSEAEQPLCCASSGAGVIFFPQNNGGRQTLPFGAFLSSTRPPPPHPPPRPPARREAPLGASGAMSPLPLSSLAVAAKSPASLESRAPQTTCVRECVCVCVCVFVRVTHTFHPKLKQKVGTGQATATLLHEEKPPAGRTATATQPRGDTPRGSQRRQSWQRLRAKR